MSIIVSENMIGLSEGDDVFQSPSIAKYGEIGTALDPSQYAIKVKSTINWKL